VVFMGAVVGHESTVEEHCIIASNAVLNARVVLETGTYVGSCATIVPEVNVGANATIGAGSLVIQDVPAGATAVGVPAELVKFSPMRAQCADEAVPAAAVLDQPGIEQALLDVWRDVLGLAAIERDQNFFDLGGRSLQVLRVRERLRQRTGRELPITDFFRFPSIRQLAEHVSLVATSEGTPLARAWARRVAVRRTFHAGGAM
jgi:acyl carrier protein